jgi:hypothetical protein
VTVLEVRVGWIISEFSFNTKISHNTGTVKWCSPTWRRLGILRNFLQYVVPGTTEITSLRRQRIMAELMFITDRTWQHRPHLARGCFLFFYYLFGVGWDWVHLVRRPLFGLLYQPRMIDDDYEAVIGMRIGGGNRSTWRKHALVPLWPPKTPHDLTWDRTRAAAVGSQRLTAWAYGTTIVLINCTFHICLLLTTIVWNSRIISE